MIVQKSSQNVNSNAGPITLCVLLFHALHNILMFRAQNMARKMKKVHHCTGTTIMIHSHRFKVTGFVR